MSSDITQMKFERQQRLSVWNQKIIEQSSILIVGVGGTGGEVAKNLALLGIGKLILVDVDTIEFSNLNRQLLFHIEDVGKYKVDVAKEAILNRYNSLIHIDTFPSNVQLIPYNVLEEIDIIAGCVDNFLARQFLNEVAIELHKPLIDSATDGYFGQIQCINTKTSACLACDSPPPPDETQVLSAPCTIVGKPRIKEHCAWKALYEFYSLYDREPNEASVNDIQELTKLANKIASENDFGYFEKKELAQLVLYHVPSLITVNAVTSGIQSQEIIKSLFSKNLSLFQQNEQKQIKSLIHTRRFRIPDLTIYSALTGNISSFELTRDPDCPVCGEKSILHKNPLIITVDPRSTCSQIFKLLKDQYKKEYVGFRGNHIIPNDEKVKNVLQNGDRITVSSLVDDEELRIKINFQ